MLTLVEYLLWVPDSIAARPASLLASNSGTSPSIEPNHTPSQALAGLFTAAWQHPCQCLSACIYIVYIPWINKRQHHGMNASSIPLRMLCLRPTVWILTLCVFVFLFFPVRTSTYQYVPSTYLVHRPSTYWYILVKVLKLQVQLSMYWVVTV